MNLIKNLKILRQQRGISQQQLAEIIMVSQQSVNKYENHNVEPGIDTLCKIADYFEVSVDYLIGRAEEPEENIEITDLTDNEHKLLHTFRKLTPTQKECISLLIDSYKS